MVKRMGVSFQEKIEPRWGAEDDCLLSSLLIPIRDVYYVSLKIASFSFNLSFMLRQTMFPIQR